MRKFLITKLVIEGNNNRKRNRATKEYLDSVYTHDSKEELLYFLAAELEKRHMTITTIKVKDITP